MKYPKVSPHHPIRPPSAPRAHSGRARPQARGLQLHLGSLSLLAALGLGLGACGDDDKGSGKGNAARSTGVFGQVTDLQGNPVSGARVRVGSASGTTNGEGRFEVKASVGEVVVRAEAEGHLPGIKRAAVAEGSPTALHLKLIPTAAAQPLDTTAGGEVVGTASARVTVPAAALVNASGAAVSGPAQVYLTPIDPSVAAQLEAAPGDFSAVRAGSGERVNLESFGMLDVTIRQGDEKLQVAPGQRLEIAIPAPANSENPPASMPLWSFDEATGDWVEEGTLTYDAATRTYVGQIEHMSFWNADQVLETTCISGRVVDAESGDPVPGAYIHGRGLDYNGSDSAHANAEGRFALLVRKSSQVAVIATHREGGGQERTVTSGDATAPNPVSPDHPSCTDVGEWRVRRGVVEFPDGRVVSCNPSELNTFRDCIPFQVELSTCFAPEGTCTYEAGGGLFSPDIVYANGARLSTSIDLNTGRSTVTFTGPGGRACGTQTTQGSADGSAQIEVTLADGRTATYGATFNEASGDITFTCANGSTRTFTAEDQAVLEACNGGGQGEDACEGDPSGGGGVGEACGEDGSCVGGAVCCVGFCLPQGLCPVGEACTDNSQCTGGDICCGATNACASAEDCRSFGGCQSDADCDGTACCEGQCIGDLTCQGECDARVGCSGDLTYCCESNLSAGGRTYCTESLQSCWDFATCDAGLPMSGQCGGTDALLCCPGEEGNSDTCRSVEDCYADRTCTQDSECGGGLTCCQSEFKLNTCQTEAGCAEFAPCDGAGAFCPAGLFCCTESPLIDLSAQPRCFESEATCNFLRPCATTAECGGGSVCCNAAGDPSLAACYPTESCPAELALP